MTPQSIADHIAFLDAELLLLAGFIQPSDTGHIHTTIHTLRWHRDLLLQDLRAAEQQLLLDASAPASAPPAESL